MDTAATKYALVFAASSRYPSTWSWMIRNQGYFSSARGYIHRQLTSYWIQRKFTSLMKSSCFLSSASIARSSMPPGVALSVWQNRSFWFSKSLSSENVQLLPTGSTFQENVTVLITTWRKTVPFSSTFQEKKKDVPQWTKTYLWPMTKRMIMPFSSSIFLLLSPVVETKGQKNDTTTQ
jgi:hypothetical protein